MIRREKSPQYARVYVCARVRARNPIWKKVGGEAGESHASIYLRAEVPRLKSHRDRMINIKLPFVARARARSARR